jgi:hypothetical protein
MPGKYPLGGYVVNIRTPYGPLRIGVWIFQIIKRPDYENKITMWLKGSILLVESVLLFVLNTATS